MAYAHKQGREGERRAAQYLQKQGIEIIEKNYRKKVGELDIIAKDNDVWVCVEVKLRRNADHGHPLETITRTKLSRMIAAFNLYLMDNKYNPAHTPMRFDIIAINNDELTWLKNVSA